MAESGDLSISMEGVAALEAEMDSDGLRRKLGIWILCLQGKERERGIIGWEDLVAVLNCKVMEDAVKEDAAAIAVDVKLTMKCNWWPTISEFTHYTVHTYTFVWDERFFNSGNARLRFVYYF